MDRRNGGDGALESLQAAHGRELPDTMKVATADGVHLYFRAPPGTRSRELAPGVELKAEGRYVVAPGSVHPSGKVYTLLGGEPADAPHWFVADARERGNGHQPTEGPIPEGQRNKTLASIAGRLRRDGLGAAAIEAALQASTPSSRCSPPTARS